ncbi:MAG: right-handed parallel beta-helix repeat-containing protein [Pseudomonadota bacterium]
MRNITKSLGVLSAAAFAVVVSGASVGPVAFGEAAAQTIGGFPIVEPNKNRGVANGKKKTKEEDKPTQIVVDANGSGPYTTISKALKDIGEGGIIYVLHGEYRESLNLTKSVYIQGDRGPGSGVEILAELDQPCLMFEPEKKRSGAHAVVANVRLISRVGSGAPACVDVREGVFTMKESNVRGSKPDEVLSRKVDGLDTDGKPAIRVSGGVALLEKNHITKGSVGVMIKQNHTLSQSMIVDNKIDNNTVGIDLSGRADVIVAGNDIFDNLETGIISDGLGGATVIGNKIRNNSGNGIILHKNAKISLLRYNRIVQNGQNGVFIPLGAPGVIEGNEIVGNGGRAIFFTETGIRPKVINNVFQNNKGDKRRGGLFSGN